MQKSKTMRNRLLILFIFLQTLAYSQYTSPGNGDNYTLNDLVNLSSGVVSFNGLQYEISADLTISAGDTFTIDTAADLLMANDVLITSLGLLHFDGGNEWIDILPINSGQHYKGLRIEDNSNSVLRKVTMIDGGGVRILNADIIIDNCFFSSFNTSNSTGVINLFQASPTISNCLFQSNEGPVLNSGANIFSAPKIYNSILELNNTANTNAPQINLGPSGPSDTIIISGNQIIGGNTNAGGISTSNLLGAGMQNVVIDSNLIVNNRYGITCTGNNIKAQITRNTIINNNIQNQPNLGGSGINFNGGTSNEAIVGENYFSGNLWGITIQGDAQPDMGSNVPLTGYNCFDSNGNGGIIYELYNNTPNPINAQFNDWHDPNPENVIFHNIDDSNLGLVTFSPFETGLTNVNADFTFSISSRTVSFSNNSSGDSLEYFWNFGDGSTSMLENPVHQFDTGTYIVSLLTRGLCESDQKIDTITISCDLTVDSLGIQYTIDTSNQTVTFNINATGDSVNYLWNFGTGDSSNTVSPVYQFPGPGNYSVTLRIFNTCDTLLLNDVINIPFPEGINDGISNKVKIWPNPIKNHLYFESFLMIDKVELYNINSLKVKSWKLNKSQGYLDLSNFQKGFYFLIIHHNGKKIQQRVIIE